jgi:hypothetical protein
MIATTLVRGLAIPATACLFASVVTAQCNNQDRQPQIEAGTSNLTYKPCPEITITVKLISYSTPGQCVDTKAIYRDTVYSCGVESPGNDCNPQGHKSEKALYTGGSCPSLSNIVDTEFDDWEDVPKAVLDALECKDPSIEVKSFDWSSQTTRCDGTAVLRSVGEIFTAPNGLDYVIWRGDTADWTPDVLDRPFLTPYDRANRDLPSAGVFGPLAAVIDDHPRLSGASVVANSEILSYDQSGNLIHKVAASIQGNLVSSGSFDVLETMVGKLEGEPETIVSRISYDGRALKVSNNGGGAGRVRGAGSENFEGEFRLETALFSELFWWIEGPFRIPRFAGIEYVLETNSEGTRDFVHRMAALGDGSSFLARTYELRILGDGARRPHSVTTYDALGQVIEEVVYGRYMEVTPGVLRPRTITRTKHYSGSGQEKTRVYKTDIRTAYPLSQESAAQVPEPMPSEMEWIVWL